MFRLCGDAEFMRSIWQCYDALATDGDTSSTSGACVFMPFVATLQHLITSRPSLLGVSSQMQGVGVPTSNSIPYSHSHSLDSVTAMVATAVSATVLNVVGMISTEAGLKNAAMKVQWYALLPSLYLSPRHPSLLIPASTSLTRQTHRPSLKCTYISSAYNASSRSVTALQGT